MNGQIEKILRTDVDSEPTGGQVLARVIRLERIVEKATGKTIEEAYEAPALSPTAAKQEQQQQTPPAQ